MDKFTCTQCGAEFDEMPLDSVSFVPAFSGTTVVSPDGRTYGTTVIDGQVVFNDLRTGTIVRVVDATVVALAAVKCPGCGSSV